MRRKEGLFAVIGGVVGAVLAIAVGGLTPLGALNENATYDTITCRSLNVTDGNKVVTIGDGNIIAFNGEGLVMIHGDEIRIYNDGKSVGMEIGLGGHGGYVTVSGNRGAAQIEIGEYGGDIRVYGKGDSKGKAGMSIDENGGLVTVRGKDGEGSAKMAINDNGGSVAVHGKGNTDSRAVMGVNEYGNGAVSTWDKNGYRLTTLK